MPKCPICQSIIPRSSWEHHVNGCEGPALPTPAPRAVTGDGDGPDRHIAAIERRLTDAETHDRQMCELVAALIRIIESSRDEVLIQASKRAQHKTWQDAVAEMDTPANPPTLQAGEVDVAAMLKELDEWATGYRSWTNLGPNPPYTPDVIAVMDAQEVVKRSAYIQAMPATAPIRTLESQLAAAERQKQISCKVADELGVRLRDANARLAVEDGLLRLAKCPDCDGSGVIPTMSSSSDMPPIPIPTPCQWCYERNAALSPAPSQEKKQ